MTSPGILIQLGCFIWDSANARSPRTSNIRSDVFGSFIKAYSCCTVIEPFSPLSGITWEESALSPSLNLSITPSSAPVNNLIIKSMQVHWRQFLEHFHTPTFRSSISCTFFYFFVFFSFLLFIFFLSFLFFLLFFLLLKVESFQLFAYSFCFQQLISEMGRDRLKLTFYSQ